MEQTKSTLPPPPPEAPKKKKRGCLIAVGVVLVLMIIGRCIPDGDDKNEKTEDKPAATASSSAKEDAQEAAVSLVDSAKIKQLAPLFREKKDEFSGLTWIEPKSAPKYRNTNGIYTYFAMENGEPANLRLVIQYFGDSWLFIDKYTFLIDGETYSFTNPDVERDHDTNIWEWSDTSVSNGDVAQILNAIKNAKEVKVRFHGSKYNEDKALTPAQIKSITQPIEYFEALGGRF